MSAKNTPIKPLLGPPVGTYPVTDLQSGTSGGIPSTDGDQGNPLMTPEKRQQRASNKKGALEQDLHSLEQLKGFFSTWKFPPELNEFKAAVSQLVYGFERTLLEQRADLNAREQQQHQIEQQAQQQQTQQQTQQRQQQNVQQTDLPMYETDEEELAEEIGGGVNRSSRQKRNEKGNQKKVMKPPPIYVEKKGPIADLSQLLSTEIEAEEYTTKTIDQRNVKINLESDDSYRKAVNVLQSKGMVFHTYENKQTRPFRVMAKGLDSSSDPNEIVTYLQAKGYKILRADIKLAAKTKTPLNMFILSFDRSENIDSIYKIREILRQIVTLCPMKGSKIIPQCKRCQEFGHTKNHCNKKPRCVKCAQGHLTANCTKAKEVRPTCANCGKDHPASYRGCEVAKQLKEKRKEITTKRRSDTTARVQITRAQASSVPRPQVQGTTYASVSKNTDNIKSVGQKDDVLQVILQEIKSIKQSMDDRFADVARRINRIENRPITSAPRRKR